MSQDPNPGPSLVFLLWCVCACVYVCVCMHMCVHRCVYMCVCAYVCMCMCVYMPEHVHVCVCLGVLSHLGTECITTLVIECASEILQEPVTPHTNSFSIPKALSTQAKAGSSESSSERGVGELDTSLKALCTQQELPIYHPGDLTDEWGQVPCPEFRRQSRNKL